MDAKSIPVVEDERISYERIAWRLLGTMAQINGGIIYVFMMGITDGRKDFDFNRSLPAMNVAGMAGIVYMTYMVLSLFLFRVLNGTGTTMCRPHAVIRFTSLIRK